MAVRKNVKIATKRISAIRLGEIVARIPSSVVYSLTQDNVRKQQDFATNVSLSLNGISPIGLGKIIAIVDVSTKDYSLKQS